MIPVYELKVRFVEKNTDAVSEELVYLPSSAQYMRPFARILNAPANDVPSGAPITLTAADAAKTLKALGVGNFDFVMGYNGADGAYPYEWDLGSVAPENKIADLNPNDGATNVTFVAPQTDDDHGGVLDVHLVVKDINSPNADSAGTATATAQLNVVPPVFLPLITK